MKKKILKGFLCFLLTAVMVAEGNLGAFSTYAAEKTSSVSRQKDKEIKEETLAGDDAGAEEKSENAEEEITANTYLYPFEEAVTALEQLAKERELPAVVYLADTVMLRTEPEEKSEPVKELKSADTVQIIGAGQDSEYGIWYLVKFTDETEEVTGYINSENIACVDSEFMDWQATYIRSISVIGLDERDGKYNDIEKFPSSYQSALKELKNKHPNWIFVPMNTNLDWSKSVKAQKGNKSLIHSNLSECWKNGIYSTGWAYASEAAIKYYMDPRNWLSEQNIFQFEMLGYDSTYQTLEMVESIVSGTFMAGQTVENGKTYAQTFIELAKSTNVSPILQAARVRQEQGVKGDSALISGVYAGYEGYYNYYNIQASGKTNTEVIESGLKYAKEKGWNTRYNALLGGAQFLGKDYIKVGQDTLYLQKFDLIGPSYYTHQYMQNIKAPYTEAISVYNAYNKKGLLSQAFIFRIPVYANMPAKKAAEPGKEDKITLTTTSIPNLQTDSEVTLTPLVNGKTAEGINWIFTSSNPEVATVDNNGLVKALKAGETTITCKDADDPDNPNVGSCKITVIKADIDEAKLEKPVLEEITYDSAMTLKDIALPAGYTWVNPDMVPTAAQTEYAVIYSPNEEKYNSITFNLSLIVKKKTLTANEYTIPKDLEGGAGNELSTVNLPEGFYWDNPQEKLPNTLGTYEYKASYNPDSTNYETVTDIKIPVKVICAAHNFGEWKVTEASCETDGSKVRSCSICGKEEKLILEKTGHSYESEVTKEATEEKEGIRTYTCKNCGDTYTEAIPKLQPVHVHKYTESIVQKASCTVDGQKLFECSCKDSYTEVIKASGHTMVNGRCQVCGYTETTEVPKNDNVNSNQGNGNTANSGSNSNAENSTGSNNGSNSNAGNSTGSNNGSNSNAGNNSTGNGNVNNAGNSGSGNTNASGSGNTSNTGSNSNAGNNAANGNTGTTTGGNKTENSNNTGNSNTSGSGNNNNSNTGTNSNTGSNSNVGNNETSGNTGTTTGGNKTENSNDTGNNNTSASGTDSNTGNTSGENKKPSSENNAGSTITNSNKESSESGNNNAVNAVTTEGNTTGNDNVAENKADTKEKETENEKLAENAETGTKKDNNTVTTGASSPANKTETELMSSLIENAKTETTQEGTEQTVSIQLSKNTEISQTIVEMAKKQGVNLEVELPNSLKWVIQTDSLSDIMPSQVNMNAQIVQDVVEAEAINAVVGENEYVELSLSHDGEFGFAATLVVPVEEKYIGKTANLFYYNEMTKALEFQMAALVDEEGNVALDFVHASDYAIVFADESMEEETAEAITENLSDENSFEETLEPEEKESASHLLIVCVIIMILAGAMAAAGYVIWSGKKEISDGKDFEEWLNEEKKEPVEKVTKKQQTKANILPPEQEKEPEEYLDDDVDDYREKDLPLTDTQSQTEPEEEYLDDDVDDYREKGPDLY